MPLLAAAAYEDGALRRGLVAGTVEADRTDAVVALAGAAEAQLGAERILAELRRRPLALAGKEVPLVASAGVAVNDNRTGGAADLLRHADLATYAAKGLGKGRVELSSGRVVAVEALVRWAHPTRGTVAPAEFVPSVEDTGLVVPLGRWVLAEACGQARRWHLEHPDREPLRLSVNLAVSRVPERPAPRSRCGAPERRGGAARRGVCWAAPVLIAPVQDDDVEAVVELWRRVGLVRPWNDPHHDLDRVRRHPAAAVLVGRLGDAVVASAVVGFEGHRGWLYYLAVSPHRRGEGLGRRMARAAEDWLRRAGAPKAQLMVRSGHAAAAGFYESLGDERQDVVVLGKWLR